MGSAASKSDKEISEPKSLVSKLEDVPPDLVDDMLAYFTLVHLWNNLYIMSTTDGFTPPTLICFWSTPELVEKMVRSQASQKWELLDFENTEKVNARLNLLREHINRLYWRKRIFSPRMGEFLLRSKLAYQTVHKNGDRGLCHVDVYKADYMEESDLVGHATSLQEIALRRVVKLYTQDRDLYHYFMKKACPIMWRRKGFLHPTFQEVVEASSAACKYRFTDAVEVQKNIIVTPTTRTSFNIHADHRTWAFYSFDPLDERTLKDLEAQLWLAHKTNPETIKIEIYCGSLGEIPYLLHKDTIERVDILYPEDIQTHA